MQQQSFLAQARTIIERGVLEQIERHQKIDPNGDPAKIIDLAMAQQREALERLRDDEETPPEQAELWSAVIEWLPLLARQLKHR